MGPPGSACPFPPRMRILCQSRRLQLLRTKFLSPPTIRLASITLKMGWPPPRLHPLVLCKTSLPFLVNPLLKQGRTAQVCRQNELARESLSSHRERKLNGAFYQFYFLFLHHPLTLPRGIAEREWTQKNPEGTRAQFKHYYDNLLNEGLQVCQSAACKNTNDYLANIVSLGT